MYDREICSICATTHDEKYTELPLPTTPVDNSTPTAAKLGRCECRDSKCFQGARRHESFNNRYFCWKDAVRMVTVAQEHETKAITFTVMIHPDDEVDLRKSFIEWFNAGDVPMVIPVPVPMCAACADWHEKGAN